MYKVQHRYMAPEEGGEGGSTGGTEGAPAGSGTGGEIDYSALAANFKQALSPEYKDLPALADIKDLNGLVKSYVNAQTMIGADKIVVPREGATPEEWNAFYGKLGRPEAPEKYELGTVEFPAGFPRDVSVDEAVKGLFHKHGITGAQAKGLYAEFSAMQIDAFNKMQGQQEQSVREGLEGLRAEWGNTFDKQVALAKHAVSSFGGPELKEWFNATGLGENPMMIKLFAQVGASLSEDKGFRDNSYNSGFVPNEDAAKAEIARKQTDPVFMKQYTNRTDPGHVAAKTLMDQLWQKAYPGKMTPE